MKPHNRLVILAFLILPLAAPAAAQLKDMPSQAELDPILKNADSRVKDFVATLTEFRVESAAMDSGRLGTDLKDFQQLRQLIQSAERGPTDRNGCNMEKLLGILSGVADAAMEAATWKSLAELNMCQQLVQDQNPTRYSQFGARMTMELQMLREVGFQLFNPAFRMAGAADDVFQMLGDAISKTKPKQR